MLLIDDPSSLADAVDEIAHLEWGIEEGGDRFGLALNDCFTNYCFTLSSVFHTHHARCSHLQIPYQGRQGQVSWKQTGNSEQRKS
ncbi:MAG: hypothetical protein V4805_20180 [Pseudomonadota bacterium]